ncbi:hypothetical protein Ancab_011795 [Ancistrocladus abbreviatus]
MGDLKGEIEKAACKAREFWMALDRKVSKRGSGTDGCESLTHNNMSLTSKEVSPQCTDGTEVRGTLTPKEEDAGIRKCENNFLFVSNAYRLVGIDLNSLQLEIKSLLEFGVSPRQSPPCPKLICDIDYYVKKLPVGGRIFKSDNHSNVRRGIFFPMKMKMKESKHVRELKCYKSNPIVEKVNGFVYVLHRRPIFRFAGGLTDPSFGRINLEFECEEWEALDDSPFLRNSTLFDTTECVWDDDEARNEFSNVETTFTAAGLYPPNGGLSVFHVLNRYHGKVAALMSGTTLDLELECVLCISKFALHVKPEVKAEARDIERSVLVSFKPEEKAFVDIVDVQNYICQMNSKDPF